MCFLTHVCRFQIWIVEQNINGNRKKISMTLASRISKGISKLNENNILRYLQYMNRNNHKDLVLVFPSFPSTSTAQYFLILSDGFLLPSFSLFFTLPRLSSLNSNTLASALKCFNFPSLALKHTRLNLQRNLPK